MGSAFYTSGTTALAVGVLGMLVYHVCYQAKKLRRVIEWGSASCSCQETQGKERNVDHVESICNTMSYNLRASRNIYH